VISGLNLPVEWTHIGDGPLMSELIQQCQTMEKTNKTVRLLGRMTNQDVHQIYQRFQFDLFINVSKSEGVPFSIMEALSYSIPVIATAAGGTPEIVDHSCGKVLPVDFSIDSLRESLLGFYALDSDSKESMRNNARKRWEMVCNANINYLKFKAFMESL
jgi:glycosyltransferase involved in cell wall biosynthesis